MGKGEVYSDPLWLYVQAVLHLVLPFISMEWMSVILGIVGTIGGVVLSGRAIQRLGESRGEGLVFPIGLLIFSVVAGVWEFATLRPGDGAGLSLDRAVVLALGVSRSSS